MLPTSSMGTFLGCTPSHFGLCFVCASLLLWRPLVLGASDVSVSVSSLALWPAHLCSSFFSFFVRVHFVPVHYRVSFFVPFFPPLSWSCFFCFSQSCGVRNHFCSPSCQFVLPFFVGCHTSAPNIIHGQTAPASARTFGRWSSTDSKALGVISCVCLVLASCGVVPTVVQIPT